MPALLNEVYGSQFTTMLNEKHNKILKKRKFTPSFNHYPQQSRVISYDSKYNHVPMQKEPVSNNYNISHKQNNNSDSDSDSDSDTNSNNVPNVIRNNTNNTNNINNTNTRNSEIIELRKYISELENKIKNLEEEISKCTNKLGNTVYDVFLYISTGIFMIYILDMFIKLGGL